VVPRSTVMSPLGFGCGASSWPEELGNVQAARRLWASTERTTTASLTNGCMPNSTSGLDANP
jgi:hypothetical protein